jgi:hypothetical protein
LGRIEVKRLNEIVIDFETRPRVTEGNCGPQEVILPTTVLIGNELIERTIVLGELKCHYAALKQKARLLHRA